MKPAGLVALAAIAACLAASCGGGGAANTPAPTDASTPASDGSTSDAGDANAPSTTTDASLTCGADAGAYACVLVASPTSPTTLCEISTTPFTQCDDAGGTTADACPSAGLIGCCIGGGAGDCYYDASPASTVTLAQSQCGAVATASGRACWTSTPPT